MRKQRAALAVAAALGMVALAAPLAQADATSGDTTITGATVYGGKDLVVGVSEAKTVSVVITGHDNSGLLDAQTDLTGPGGGYLTFDTKCQTATTCTQSFVIDPKVDLLNANAGTWYTGSWVDAKDGDYCWEQRIGGWSLKRAATMTVNASPEPVTKGHTITITGKLARANWEDYKYHGYTGQSVKLQFRKAGSSTYTTLKTVKTDSTGNLKTTATAAGDGYWRYSFAGTATTGTATAAGDYVDVR